jgi:two-component system, OmpR family, sensor histidine kinase QseC
MNSLRLRLVLLLFVTLGLVWAVAAWFTHAEARDEIDALFDAQLAESAQVLLGTTRHELYERIERGDDAIPISHGYEQKLAFQVWGDGGLLMHSASAPVDEMGGRGAGYSESLVKGELCRVLTLWDSRHEFMIQVAEPLAARERLARHIALKMLLPTLIILPVLALLIWLAVGAGLRPLTLIKQEVRKRTVDRLEPVSMSGVPDEILPLTQALNDLFARLQDAFEGERRFTADAAHELRTPLAALKTQAQVAMRSTDEDQRTAALANVLLGVERATHLLEQLLTLARVDPESAATGHESVELRLLAVGVLAELAPLAHAKRIDLSLNEGSAGRVVGNPVQLAILLRNLIDNAVRYTPDGGRVSVSIEGEDGCVLAVADSGPGIRREEMGRVMERFYRIPGSAAEGSGLGLSIARRIAELHGASLTMENANEGHGLVVKVAFGKPTA